MICSIIKLFQLIYLFVVDQAHRAKKLLLYYITGTHEFQRICSSQDDIYEKTFKFDQWLERTKCKPIKVFIDSHFNPLVSGKASKLRPVIASTVARLSGQVQSENIANEKQPKLHSKKRNKVEDKNKTHPDHLEQCDLDLQTALRAVTQELLEVILKSKFSFSSTGGEQELLRDILYRIGAYKFSVIVAKALAQTKYDVELDEHPEKVIKLWNNLVRADQNQQRVKSESTKGNFVFPQQLSHIIESKEDLVSNRWSHIGFQGEDPGTDFRGMGVLGLIQLEYLSCKPKKLALDLLRRSLNEKHGYPFAIVGINITYNLLNLFKDGSMKHLYYDFGDVIFRDKHRALNLLEIFNDIYVELFLRFDCFWHESKPSNIFEFRELMQKFVDIVRMDLFNRTFALKFIY